MTTTNEQAGQRFVFEAGDLGEGSSIRAVGTEEKGDDCLSVLPAFSRVVTLRSAVNANAPASALASSEASSEPAPAFDLASVAGLPGVTLAYAARTQPTGLRARCSHPGVTRATPAAAKATSATKAKGDKGGKGAGKAAEATPSKKRSKEEGKPPKSAKKSKQ